MPALNLGVGDKSTSGPNATSRDRIEQAIQQNDKATRKISSMQAKIMHQRDIHQKRMKEFVEAIIEKLQSIYASLTEEMQVTLRYHQEELAAIHKKCVDRALALRTIKDQGGRISDEELIQLQRTMGSDEKLVESLSIYDLTISPPLVGFADILLNEAKPIYIRTSSVYPLGVEMVLVPNLQITGTSSVLVVTAIPDGAEPRLPSLLVGRLEKLQAGNDAVVETTEGVVTALPDRIDGGSQVAFVVPQSIGTGISGYYQITVTLYGRLIRNSPIKLRIRSPLDLVETIEEIPSNEEEIFHPPPAAFADRPSGTSGQPGPGARSGLMQETAFNATQDTAPRTQIPQQYVAPTTTAAPPPAPLPSMSFGNGSHFEQPAEEAIVRGTWSSGVGRGRSLNVAPSVIPGGASANVNLGQMEEFVSNMATDKGVFKEKVAQAEEDPHQVSSESIVRMPRRTWAVESITGATENLVLDDRTSRQGNLANIGTDAQRDVFGDQFSLSRSRNQSAEAGDHGAATYTEFRRQRADLRGLLGNNTRTDIAGELVTKFGREKRQDPSEQCFSFPIGCTKNEFNGGYIICDTGHHVVKLFDRATNLTRVNAATFNRPAAVVPLDNKRYAVRDDRMIQVFSEDGVLLQKIGENVNGRGYGLSLDSSGNLLTLVLGGRRGSSYIACYDPSSGEEVTHVLYTPHMDKPGSKCRFLDCFNDRVYVADLGASMIYCTSLEGGVNILEFGGSGTAPGKFVEPSGITIDANGNLFIGDSRNDRIEIFSPDGTFTGMVKFDYPIKRPSGIHLTADGHLMVMNYIQHYVSLFKLRPLNQ